MIFTLIELQTLFILCNVWVILYLFKTYIGDFKIIFIKSEKHK